MLITQNELEVILESFSQSVETEEQTEDLIAYILVELRSKNGYEPTDEEISLRSGQLIEGYILRKLTEQGLIESYIDSEDFDNTTFNLTDLGREVGEELCVIK